VLKVVTTAVLSGAEEYHIKLEMLLKKRAELTIKSPSQEDLK